MASKIVYSVVAVAGIAAASGAAWWYQSRPQGPQEIGGAPASARGASGSANTSGIGAPAGTASAPRPAGVEVAQVEKMSMQDDAQAVGSLKSRQSVMLRPEVPGRVKELGFTDGARVRKGQVMVQMDDTLQRAEVRQASAQLSIAQANFKRNQELVAQNFVAQRVLEESSANVQVAEAQLSLSCARLSRMAILAPFDGAVGIRNVNLGDFVKDGADLVNIEDISSMYVDFRLPERFQGKLKPQQTVEVALDAFPARVFKARVEAIDPLLDANGRSVGVRAVLPNTMGEAARSERRGPGAGGAPPAGAKPVVAGAKPEARAGGSGRPQGATQPVAAPSSSAARGSRPAVDTSGCPSETLVAPALAGTRVSGATVGPGRPGGGNPAPLRPGMFARVTTVFSINDAALVVPEEAIVPQGGRQFVIRVVEPAVVPAPAASAPALPVLPPDTKFVSLRQEVKLGVRRAGKVEITDGLSEGQTIVVAGQQRLQRDGSPLRIVDMARPPQGAASAPSTPGAATPGSSAPSSAVTPALPASR